ncbi:MAG: PAS domain S-box protein [Ignavibacteriaceae bacterium]|nr:PAS domain S-box protein [Ignavibacteriaceae bacterium]
MVQKSESQKPDQKRGRLSHGLTLLGFAVSLVILFFTLEKFFLYNELTPVRSVLNKKLDEFRMYEKERMGEPRFIFRNPVFSELIGVNTSRGLSQKSQLFFFEMLGKIKANHDYLNMVIYSADNRVLFSFSDSLDGIENDRIKDAIDSARIVKGKLFYSEKYKKVVRNYYLPVLGDDSLLLGYVILSANYNPVFFKNLVFQTESWKIHLSTLIKVNGKYLYFNPVSDSDNWPGLYPTTKLDKLITAEAENSFASWEDLTGETEYFVKKNIGESDFQFVAGIAESDLHNTVYLYIFYYSLLFGLGYIFLRLLIGRERRTREIVELNNKLRYEVLQTNLIKKYEALFKSANDAILTITPEGRIIIFNKKALEYYGYSPAEMENLSLIDFTPAALLGKMNEFLEETRKTGSGIMDIPQISKAGLVFEAQISASLQVENGSEFIQAIIRDVTESRRYQNLLKSSENKFRRLANLTEELIYGYDLIRNSIHWDGAISGITGYPQEDFVSFGRKEFLSLMNAETALKYIEGFENAKNNQSVFRFEFSITTGKGERSILTETGEFIGSDISPAGYYIGVIKDITAVRLYEKKILENQLKYKYLLQSSEEGLIIVRDNDETEIITMTGSPQLGYKEEELSFEFAFSLIHPDDVTIFEDAYAKVRSSDGNKERIAIRIKGKGGEFTWLEIDMVNRTDTPEVGGIVFSYRSVDELKRYEKTFYKLATSIYSSIGQNFLENLLKQLQDQLKADYLFLGQTAEDNPKLYDTVVLLNKDERIEDIRFNSSTSPFNEISTGPVCFYEKDVRNYFPQDNLLSQFGANAFFSVTLYDSSNRPFGILAAVYQNNISNGNEIINILKIFAARAAAELERTESERSLRRSQEMYESLVRNIPVGIFRVTSSKKSEFDFHYASPKFYELTGIEPFKEPLTAALFADTIYTADRGKLLSTIQASLETVRNFHWEGRAIVKGELRWFFISGKTYKNGNNIVFSEVILEDITTEKVAEIELKESEEKFRRVWENLRDSIIITNSKAKIISASPAFFKFYGYRIEQVLNKDLFKFMPPSAIIECDHIIRDLYSNKSIPAIVTTSIFHKDGRVLDVESSISIISDKTGERLVLWLMRDTTEKKFASKRIESLTRQFATFFENSPMGMAILDSDMNYISVNKVVAEINNIPAEEHKGKNLRTLFPAVADYFAPYVNEIIKGKGTSHSIRLTGNPPGRGGAETHFAGSIFGLYDGNGALIAIGLLFLDVTKEILAEQELKDKFDEIARTNKLMIGREIKMLELKKEVNSLMGKLNLAPKYNISAIEGE